MTRAPTDHFTITATIRMHALTLASVLVVVGFSVLASPVAGQHNDRPNVVLIMCDDLGFSDLGCYGSEIETHTLDRLAARGMRFRSFYNNAKCETTRASLLTGHWWHHVGASPSAVYRATTFAEQLRDAGYRTLMAGKWHAGQLPHQRGFDRHYGLADGCCNYWNPGHARLGEPEPARKRVRRWAIDDRQLVPYTPQRDDFYTTDAFTDAAIEYLSEYRDDTRPFLLYMAYTAPHYPLHAPREDVAKYRGRYRAIGWDRLRHERFARQQELGVLPENAKLSPRDPGLPSWDSVPDEDRDWWDLRMATYAAMIDRMDRNIGRLLTKLDELGKLDNTVIFFLSDNGACEDSADRSTVQRSMPWEVTSYLTQGRVWANASNTPYRQYKTTTYEGGIRTPMIAFWPGAIQPGSISDHVGHVIDFLPTMLEMAQAEVPADLPGHSLVPVLHGGSAERPWPIYWQFGASRAIRDRQWKLVAQRNLDWELYHVELDPTELTDLASAHPAIVTRLAAAWDAWWAEKGTNAAAREP